MPSTNIPVVPFTRQTTDGLNLAAALTAVDGVNGNNFTNNGETLLRVKNAAGSAVTLSVKLANVVDGQTVPAKTYTIPATTGDRLIGPFPVALYGEVVEVTYSSGTSVTAAPLQPGN